MSDSYHVTIKNFRNCSKLELSEQAQDSESDMSHWAEKRSVKREIKRARKDGKQQKKL